MLMISFFPCNVLIVLRGLFDNVMTLVQLKNTWRVKVKYQSAWILVRIIGKTGRHVL